MMCTINSTTITGRRMSTKILQFYLLAILAGTIVGHSSDWNKCPNRCQCSSTTVDCSKRNLKSIPWQIPEWTESLHLNDNPIEVFSDPLPSLIISPNNLTMIDLTRTELRLVNPYAIQNVFNDAHFIEIKLVKIKFDENRLTKFPLMFNLTNLRYIGLSNNQLDSDSITGIDVFATYPLLESIDLSFNAIRRIPENFLASGSNRYAPLTQLILNNNQIETIEDNAFKAFPNLKVLKLSKNNLATVSKTWLGPLHDLKELDLNYNQINKIDILAFEGLKSLQMLKMRRNKLDDLPDGSFWGLSNLQKLNLDHNNIFAIGEGWTYGLKSLKELTLKHNSITNIHDNSWNSARNLIELRLDYNKLTQIKKATFDKLSSLQILRLSNNNISNVDENSLRILKNLQILDLSVNKLSWTLESSKGFFQGLSKLRELRLDQNQISLIYSHTFNGLTGLKSLNLSANPIFSIQNDSFSEFNNLEDLYLENVDLFCDCNIQWLSRWLQASETRRRLAKNIRCKHPHEFAVRTSKSFLDVDPNEFKCQNHITFLKPYWIGDDFHNSNNPIAAIKNKDTTLYCKVATSSQSSVIFQWFKNNQMFDHERATFTVTTQASENVTNYISALKLSNVQDEDQGNYYCMASNSYGKVYSREFTVNIAPYFIKEPRNVTVKVGQTAKLECSAKGQPNPTIYWRKDDSDNFPAAMQRRMHVMPADDVFFIVEVTNKDMGSYTCHAANNVGTIGSTAFLNVIEEPSFVRKMVDKKATIGSVVSLECMVSGIPTPNITWFKDGNLLNPTERHFFTTGGQLLKIVQVQLSDQGVYTCYASNTYGTIHNSSHLHVLNSFTEKRNENDSFASVIRVHVPFLVVIILCVGLTSIVWIVVLCYYLRHKQYRQDEPFRNTLSDKFSSHQNTKIDLETDIKSETSSAKDTGYGEEDQDQDVKAFNSLPRNGYYNSEYHPTTTTIGIGSWSRSLSRKPPNLNMENLHISSYKHYRSATMLSSKQLKRNEKIRRFEKLNYPRYIIQHPSYGNDDQY